MQLTDAARTVPTPCRKLAAVWAAFVMLAAAVTVHAGDNAPATPAEREHIELFETRIRPLLAKHCYECHGSEKQRGGLRLDSRAAMLAGGESGAAIEPGDPTQSLLMAAVNYEALEMPPSGQISAGEIELLARWIELGAPWPGEDSAAPADVRPAEPKITDEDRAWWAFQPLADVAPPALSDPWIQGPLDAFILERLASAGLRPAPPADRRVLARRAYFDLWGLPPTPEQLDEFLRDERPDAFARLVDRLLEHPHYGQRWARHWLDLARYAESDGYRQDAYRPNAWRYRDYVIDSLNADKPYDQFVTEQLAGDQIDANDPELMAATGFLRHTIYEYNQRDVNSQWDYMVGEVTEVAADVFLAMGLACARCHDHKFDPLLQSDYFRFRAFFEPILPRDDLLMGSAAELAEYRKREAQWLEATREIRLAIERLEQPLHDPALQAAIDKFPPDIRPALWKRPADRAPREQQIAALAYRQIDAEMQNLGQKLTGEQLEQWKSLRAELAKFDHLKPPPLPRSFGVTDVGPQAPPTTIPDSRRNEVFEPALFEVLGGGPVELPEAERPSNSTGRRLALARWITHPENPLATRVIVNRVWQYHFGEGIVRTSSDFGRLGEPPTHPELLDWLTRQFIREGWSLKALHRLIMNSATYQQSSHGSDVARAMQIDPENRLLWHWSTRRLDAEQVRDAMLLVSGELVPRGGGPSAEHTEPVRSIYTRVLRNTRDPLLDVFDAPDAFSSTARRNVTTTPTQSLLLINSDVTLARAQALAASLAVSDSTASEAPIQQLYHRLFGRAPEPDEVAAAKRLLEIGNAGADASQQPPPGLVDLCHVLLNSSEFLYVE